MRFTLALAGAMVTAVGTVPEALRALDRARYDVLLSDIALPGEDGRSLIRRIRQLPVARGGGMPAAAVTAFNTATENIRAGFQRHLRKPVDASQLVTAVAELAIGVA